MYTKKNKVGPCSRKLKIYLFDTTHITSVIYVCISCLFHVSHAPPILYTVAATACARVFDIFLLAIAIISHVDTCLFIVQILPEGPLWVTCLILDLLFKVILIIKLLIYTGGLLNFSYSYQLGMSPWWVDCTKFLNSIIGDINNYHLLCTQSILIIVERALWVLSHLIFS